jgi:flagellar assembly protein FliH
MKTPQFMQGVTRSTSDPMHAANVPPGQLREVSWAVAPREVAGRLPMQTLTAPSLNIRPLLSPAPPPSLTPPPAGFEAMPSSQPSAPSPPPSVEAAPPPPPHAPRDAGQSARVEAAISTLKLIGERLAEQARSDALELGLLVARRIIEREVSTNIDALFSLIKSAIRRVGESRTTTVRLSPGDFARLKDAAETSFTLGRVELQADEALGPGDVMVDSDNHSVDGRLSTRLEEITRALDGQDAQDA